MGRGVPAGGQTEYNLIRRYQGGLDSPLTLLGERQARAIGPELARHVPADTPFAVSPLGRTRATARLIAESGGLTGPVTLDPRLAELTLGDWDGRTAVEIEAQWPGLREAGPRHEWLFRAPGGESYEALTARLGGWLAEALEDPRPLIVVSHGVAGAVLRGLYARLSREEMLSLDAPQDTVFVLEGGRVERIVVEGAAAGA